MHWAVIIRDAQQRDWIVGVVGPFDTLRDAEYYAANGDYHRNYVATVMQMVVPYTTTGA